ncbi:MAG: iron-containing alcohol dehydrogenase [Thermodesulfobacteriota bacterium]
MDQKIHSFFSPNKVLFGIGASREIGKEAKALGGTKVLIVTDPGVVNSGLVSSLRANLEEAGMKVFLFDRVEPEPSASLVDESAQLTKENGVDVVIGVGGGSSLDIAKGASLLASNPGNVLDYCGLDLIPKRGLPKILVPTTAGTGSEVTRVFVLTDKRDNMKKVVFSNYALPELALVDPMLTISMPSKVTADSGMDALVHAIETYVSMNATPFSDLLASKAIELIAKYLPMAFAKGENIEARYHMSLASLLAGMAFASGGLGAVHALAYPLGTEYHLPHGRTNAIMLAHVMEFNSIGNRSRYALIAEMMGKREVTSDLRAGVVKAVEAVVQLLDDVQIPYHLKDYGIPKEAIPKLVEGGMRQARLFVPNPRDLREKDVEAIYTKAW